MQDDLFFLNRDKSLYENKVIAAVPEVAPVENTPPITAVTAVEVVAEIAVVEKPVEFNYMGKKGKDFLLLVHYPELYFIHNTHLTALENILKRKGYEIDDVAIFNIAKHDGIN